MTPASRVVHECALSGKKAGNGGGAREKGSSTFSVGRLNSPPEFPCALKNRKYAERKGNADRTLFARTDRGVANNRFVSKESWESI